ncbi:hypothetical protein SCHPADRAFT_892935 [Schizopora paradoxa]|uniref:Uncharacterized protein n=1 Tax=Schizopora paradoxa TaxID=27342 RepID=A0A0H2RDP1_9AGAM|nr:hypothetical protein SCHPADRAFT_892935 [Schizopora paradoxa]
MFTNIHNESLIGASFFVLNEEVVERRMEKLDGSVHVIRNTHYRAQITQQTNAIQDGDDILKKMRSKILRPKLRRAVGLVGASRTSLAITVETEGVVTNENFGRGDVMRCDEIRRPETRRKEQVNDCFFHSKAGFNKLRRSRTHGRTGNRLRVALARPPVGQRMLLSPVGRLADEDEYLQRQEVVKRRHCRQVATSQTTTASPLAFYFVDEDGGRFNVKVSSKRVVKSVRGCFADARRRRRPSASADACSSVVLQPPSSAIDILAIASQTHLQTSHATSRNKDDGYIPSKAAEHEGTDHFKRNDSTTTAIFRWGGTDEYWRSAYGGVGMRSKEGTLEDGVPVDKTLPGVRASFSASKRKTFMTGFTSRDTQVTGLESPQVRSVVKTFRCHCHPLRFMDISQFFHGAQTTPNA